MDSKNQSNNLPLKFKVESVKKKISQLAYGYL